MSSKPKKADSPANQEEAHSKEQNSALKQLSPERELAKGSLMRKRYFLGATPDCKRTYITVGGKSFPVFSCEITQDQSEQDVEIVVRGGFVDLTKEEYDKLVKSIRKKGIRFLGENSVQIFFHEGAYQDNEYPLAMFLYLHDVEELTKVDPHGWRNSMEILTIMARDKEATKAFGNGWIDANGNKNPLRKKFSKDRVERADRRPEQTG